MKQKTSHDLDQSLEKQTSFAIKNEEIPVKILKEECRSQFGHLTVISEEILLKNNTVKSFHIIDHPGAVVIIPEITKDKFLLIKQYRHSIRKWIYEFPAGTLSQYESPAQCARRELEEETGYQCQNLISLGEILPAPGFCNEIQYGFVAKNLTPTGDSAHNHATKDEDEYIEVEEFSLQKILNLARDGLLQDAKSLAFLLKLELSKNYAA